MTNIFYDALIDRLSVDSITTRIPELISILIIGKNGKLIKNINYNSAERIEKTELEFFASLIDLRYSIVGFEKILSGLEMTVNIFRDHCIFVTRLNYDFIMAVITKNSDIEKTSHAIIEIKKCIVK